MKIIPKIPTNNFGNNHRNFFIDVLSDTPLCISFRHQLIFFVYFTLILHFTRKILTLFTIMRIQGRKSLCIYLFN